MILALSRLPKNPAHLAHRLGDRRQAASLGRASRCSRRSRSARYRRGMRRPRSAIVVSTLSVVKFVSACIAVGGEFSIEPIREPCGRLVDMAAEFDDRRLRQTVRPHDLAGAAAALTNVGEAQRRGGDEDIFVAEVDQMTSANGAGLFVVDRHGVGGQIARHAVRDHVRGLGGLNELPARKIVGAGNDDQSCRTPCEDRLQPGSLHRLPRRGSWRR